MLITLEYFQHDMLSIHTNSTCEHYLTFGECALHSSLVNTAMGRKKKKSHFNDQVECVNKIWKNFPTQQIH